MGHFTYLDPTAADINHYYTPYNRPAYDLMYNLLFSDNWYLLKENFTHRESYPLSQLFDEQVSISELLSILDDYSVDSRLRLLAFNILNAKGGTAHQRELLGVVVEVHMEEGLDVLVVYADNNARYFNYAGHMIIWENQDNPTFTNIKNQLFNLSTQIINQIGPWEKTRLKFPDKNKTRLSFLMSDGLYFGEGYTQSFFEDALAAPTLGAAVEMLHFLTTFGKKT